MNLHPLPLGLLLALSAAAAIPTIAGAATPYFRYEKTRMEAKHAYAFMREERRGPASIHLFLTTEALDAQKAADAFDPGSEVDRQVGSKPGGYVRICITHEGEECGLYFSHHEPLESFNLSGSGEFRLVKQTPTEVEGRWHLDTPADFFGKTYDFDLPFATRVTQPSAGTPLGAGGGDPGKAYQAWVAALAKGDLPVLRRMIGEDRRWLLPQDDGTSAKEALKDLRDGKPVSAKIVSGVQRGDRAVLRVEGVDRDDIRRAGRVLMVREEGAWRLAGEDLGSVD